MKIETGAVIKITDIDLDFRESLISANRHNNPEYVQAVKYGYRTIGIEPFIHDYSYDEEADELTIPRGIGQRMRLEGVQYEAVNTVVSNPVNIAPSSIELRGYQDHVFDQVGNKEEGVIIAPTGAGKTILGLTLIERKQEKALILVHTKELLQQWHKIVKAIFGFEPGIVNDKLSETDMPVTIAMFQTANSNIDKLDPTSYGLVLVDECHHSPATTFANVLDQIPAKFRYGLSATPNRRDSLEGMLFNRLGPAIAKITKDMVEEAGGIVPARITTVSTGINPTFDKKVKYKDKQTKKMIEKTIKDAPIDSWHEYLVAITENDARNQFIADIANKSAKTIPTLILVDRIEHAEAIYERAGGLLLHGQLDDAGRKQAMIDAQNAPLTIGTTGLLGEGIDVSGWGHLILASPISGEGRLLQGIGRVIRPSEGKEFGYVTDLIDLHPLPRSSARKREAIYNERKYPIKRLVIDVNATAVQPKLIDLGAIREQEKAEKLAQKEARDAEKAAERAAIDERKRQRAIAKELRESLKAQKAALREQKLAIKEAEAHLKETKHLTMRP